MELNTYFIKKIFAIFCVFSVVSFFAVSQDSSQSENLEQSITLNTNNISQSENISIQDNQMTVSTVAMFLRMILVLVIVLSCIFLLFHFLKKNMKASPNTDPFLRDVSSITLAPGKSVHVITLLDNAYLLGVTDNAVNLIGEVKDKTLVDAMNVYADKTNKVRKPQNFNEMLSLFMPNGFKVSTTETKEESVYGDSADNAKNLFKHQRERLNGDER